MSITKIILYFLLIYIIYYYFEKNKKNKEDFKNDKSGVNTNGDNIETYIEKDDIGAKVPSKFMLSDMKDYKKDIKDMFKLTERDYKKLIELPNGDKPRINLKKDWKQILNHEIDSIDNDIDIKYTELKNNNVDSQFAYDVSLNVNKIFEYDMDTFDKALDGLINEDMVEYVLENTNFDNIFEDKDFDYYSEYKRNSKRYFADGTLNGVGHEPLTEKTHLLSSYNKGMYTYESQCDLDKRLGSLVFTENDLEKLGSNTDNEGRIVRRDLNDIYKELNTYDDYHDEYIRIEIPKAEEKPFKLIEYNDVTESLVEKFKDVESLVVNKLNNSSDLTIQSNSLNIVENVATNLKNTFEVIDRKINYILKNTEIGNEYFINGEIVVYRKSKNKIQRNHGVHIKVEALIEDLSNYIIDYDILGIVINDKINRMDAINSGDYRSIENMLSPLYFKFKDKHVITKDDLEKELAKYIDYTDRENFNYLLKRFKKIRTDLGIMVSDFQLVIYTGKILMDIERSDNFNAINQFNNPSLLNRIFS